MRRPAKLALCTLQNKQADRQLHRVSESLICGMLLRSTRPPVCSRCRSAQAFKMDCCHCGGLSGSRTFVNWTSRKPDGSDEQASYTLLNTLDSTLRGPTSWCLNRRYQRTYNKEEMAAALVLDCLVMHNWPFNMQALADLLATNGVRNP